MKSIVIGNGEIINYNWLKESLDLNAYIICSDGGLLHLDKIGVVPDLIVGDFDSIDINILDKYRDRVELIKFPPEKDYTDMELGVNFAIDKSYGEIDIYGGIGSRLDHSIGNIQLLLGLMQKNIIGRLIDEHNIAMVSNEDISIRKEKKFISIIPLTNDLNISTNGLKYELNRENIAIGTTRGISNEFDKDRAFISIYSGIGLFVQSQD